MSGLDGAFLHIETPDTPMHVGALYLLNKPAGLEGSYFEEVKRLLMPRLAMSPFFRARLAPVPFNLANPVWVEDQLPNPEYHLRQVLLPHPGDLQQLQDKVAELHAELLDRNQPLWELTVIDGLADGKVAIYTKVHHAALDGASAVALAKVLFDSSATPTPVPDNWRELALSQSQPSSWLERMTQVMQQTRDQYTKLAATVPDLLKLVSESFRPTGASPAAAPSAAAGLAGFTLGPKTPLNVPIDSRRGFAALTLPLAQLKQFAAVHDIKLNDVVLALCSGALRRYLLQHRCLPRQSLVASIPVSTREAGDTSTTTQVTLGLVKLATQFDDPLKRLKSISSSSKRAKKITGKTKSITPIDFPSLGMPWLLRGLASLYGASKITRVVPPIANVMISNVPGPQQPLFVAGAEIVAYWPISIVEHGLGLNVTVMSYCDSLEIGLTVAQQAVPDVHLLAQMVKDAYEELMQLPAPNTSAATEAANTAPPRRRRTAAATTGKSETAKPKPRARKAAGA